MRGILRKRGCESRDEASLWWRSYNRPTARLARTVRGVTAFGSLKIAGTATAGTVAIGAVAMAVLAMTGGGDGSAPMDAANLPDCTPEELHIAMGQQPAGRRGGD